MYLKLLTVIVGCLSFLQAMEIPSQEKELRLFIAANIPDTVLFTNIQKFTAKTINSLLASKNGQFVPEFIHLSLLFIGGVPQSKVKQVIQAVQEAVTLFVNTKGKGALQSLSIAPGASILGKNAVVMDVKDPLRVLELLFIHLYNQVVKVVKPAQILPWKGHITLGRIQPLSLATNPTVKNFLPDINPPLGARGELINPAETFTINQIALYKSEYKQGQSVYTPLINFAL